jgi:hypothetical protein
LDRITGTCWALALWFATWPAFAQNTPEAKDMALVGYNDLQARSAYQPVIHQRPGDGSPISATMAGPMRS